jgi:hypothetical protein
LVTRIDPREFDEMLTVTRLGLPPELRRLLACTNMIENVMGTLRRVCQNVKCWRSPSMALRWAGAAMQEAAKGFRRLKARKQLPLLKAALADRTASAAAANRQLDKRQESRTGSQPETPAAQFSTASRTSNPNYAAQAGGCGTSR